MEKTIIKTEIDVDSLKKSMNELGILMSNNEVYKLLIWNDDVNDMLHIVKSLKEICELNEDECIRVMMEAHIKGKSVAKTGTFEELSNMKDLLNIRMINATIEN